MRKELILFEFSGSQPTGLDGRRLGDFKAYLEEVWENRNRFWNASPGQAEHEAEIEDVRAFRQGFLRFDGSRIRARNYVGFIQFEDLRVSIYPKVFEHFEAGNTTSSPSLVECQRYLDHMLYWLSYCSRVRFPFSAVPYRPQDTDGFLEALIYLFAHYTAQLLDQESYQCYEEVTEPTEYLKGTLATTEYFKESVSTANWHRFYCRYEPFQSDNQFNRIIKQVAKQLLHVSRQAPNQEALRRINLRLEEVTDTYCTYEDCRKVKLNRLYTEWEPVLSMCKMFLAGQTVNHRHEEQANFCFLLPMEYVFEDFIAGFLSRHFSPAFRVRPQASDLSLTDEGIFRMYHDVLLIDQETGQQIIVDTKYKIRSYPFKDNKKADVSQADMYQIISYAMRRGCRNVVLLYPRHDVIPEKVTRVKSFSVSSPLASDQKVCITTLEAPLLASYANHVEANLFNFFNHHLLLHQRL